MARSSYKFVEGENPHFLTCTVVEWLPIFTRPEVVAIILDSLRFLQQEQRLRIYAYVIMVNHLHLIASSSSLSKEIGDFKSYTARRIIDLLKERGEQRVLQLLSFFRLRHRKDRRYQFWQEGSHPQYIQTDQMMRQKIEYIHNNPVEAGFVDDPLHWRYSSARNYAGLPGLLDVEIVW